MHLPLGGLIQSAPRNLETLKPPVVLLSSRSVKDFVALMPLLVALSACGERQADGEANAQEAAYREKYAKAKALFDDRCKSAGVVVKRTVKDVEGLELTKIRQPLEWGGKAYFDPMFPEAAMASEVRGDDYIKQFLMYEYRKPSNPGLRGQLGPLTIERSTGELIKLKGYAFVEYLEPVSGSRYRCTPDWSLNHPNWVPGQHHCVPVKESITKFALDYEDLVDAEDRLHWVAGTRLKIIDKRNGETVAELTRFVWDPGFGGSSTGRWPWQHAATAASTVCPSDASQPLHHDSRYFVDAVLLPKQGN